MENILKPIEPAERRPLPLNPEEAWKVLEEEAAPQYPPEELKAWELSCLLDGYVLFLKYYPEKVWERLHPSLLLILLKYTMALDSLKEVKL